jgi:glycosyltransferase involved in cell wall biosynthesis
VIISFVIPWYGDKIAGGAEHLCRTLAEHLTASGVDVEVLTTCARDFFDWSNRYREGIYTEGGVRVRRFKADNRDFELFDDLKFKLLNDMGVSREEELLYMRESINSKHLYSFMEREKNERVFILIPYMFGTTYNGVKIAPQRSYIIPCLHDENYAGMSVFKDMFQEVGGVIFNAEPEMALAKRLYGPLRAKTAVIGAGVDTEVSYDPDRFLGKYGVKEPFMLYVGRKDECKNTPCLLEYFNEYKKRQDNGLKLVLIGGGSVDMPSSMTGDIIDLGYVSEEDKNDAHAAAAMLCQPSENESFSLVIMDSWVAGTPVIVHEDCEVTRWHCKRSNGGLYFEDYYEFASCIDFYLEDPDRARLMAENGRRYVERNYSWNNVIDQYRRLIGV